MAVEKDNVEIVGSDEENNWYVFYVNAKHERKVEKLLIRDGYECYLPLVTTLKQWKHRKKHVEEPLFKSYIFIRIKKNQIYDVLQTPSLITYIRFNGEPAAVPNEQILLIAELIKNKTKFTVSNEKVKVGELLTLKTGPFEGYKGVVKEIRGKKKMLVVLTAIDFTLEIEM